jgi:hypothetical protein
MLIGDMVAVRQVWVGKELHFVEDSFMAEVYALRERDRDWQYLRSNKFIIPGGSPRRQKLLSTPPLQLKKTICTTEPTQVA